MGHLRDNGFEVDIVDVADMNAVKVAYGIAPDLMSCHTALVGDHIFEGHVPADAIKRFLEEDSDWVGLSVPGMPQGSPGMEGPNPVRYDVRSFDRDGRSVVYESH